jgi:hypothetical protein
VLVSASIQSREPCDYRVGVKGGRTRTAFVPKALPKVFVLGQLQNGVCGPLHIPGRKEEACLVVPEEITVGFDVGGDDWDSVEHRLCDGPRVGLCLESVIVMSKTE